MAYIHRDPDRYPGYAEVCRREGRRRMHLPHTCVSVRRHRPECASLAACVRSLPPSATAESCGLSALIPNVLVQGICQSAVDIRGTARRRLDREALARSKLAVEKVRKPLGQDLLTQTRRLHGLQGDYFIRMEDLLSQVYRLTPEFFCRALQRRKAASPERTRRL